MCAYRREYLITRERALQCETLNNTTGHEPNGESTVHHLDCIGNYKRT